MVFFWKIKSGEKFFVYFIHMCINNSELSFSKLKCIGGTLRFFGVCLKQFFFCFFCFPLEKEFAHILDLSWWLIGKRWEKPTSVNFPRISYGIPLSPITFFSWNWTIKLPTLSKLSMITIMLIKNQSSKIFLFLTSPCLVIKIALKFTIIDIWFSWSKIFIQHHI